MSDLVERLRKGEALPFSTYDEEVLSGLAGEAADEIERLQAVVDAARVKCHGRLDHPVRHFEVDGDCFYYRGATDMAAEILRALDGEPCQKRDWMPCPSCGANVQITADRLCVMCRAPLDGEP